MKKISTKRILTALSPLIVFNLVLIVNLTLFKNTAWSQKHDSYEWGKNERLYVAKKSQKIEDKGKLLFDYEGEDANCWQKEKDWQTKECLRKHPYGGEGTLITGGNLNVDNAQGIYLNGYDASGRNWIMSTTSEPYGNTMSSSYGTSTDILYGNNLIANGTIKSGSLNFEAASSSVVFDDTKEYMVDDGVVEEVKMLAYNNSIDDEESNVLEVLDRDVCGVCEDTCRDGKAGDGYRFVSNHGLDVKENTKVNEEIRLCGYVEECEEACCRLTEYLADDTWDNFVGYTCASAGSCAYASPPENCFAHEGEEPCTHCYPQPYRHFPRQEKPSLSTEYYEKNEHLFRR